MHSLIDFTNNDDIVYWSAITTAHFLLLRAGEFVVTDSSQVVPTISDVNIKKTLDGQEYMTLYINKSKTDQKQEGIVLYCGHASHKVCAVCSMKKNLQLQNQQHGTQSSSHLFRLATGLPVSRENLRLFLTSLLGLLGIPADHYSTHSFRIGGATSAAIAGLKDFEIQLLGRWSSDCYKRYIRSPLNTFIDISKRISTTQDNTYQYASPYQPSDK